MEGCQSERIDWTCKCCKAHRYQCVECGDSVIEDGEGGELCEACFRTPRTAADRIRKLERALKIIASGMEGDRVLSDWELSNIAARAVEQ